MSKKKSKIILNSIKIIFVFFITGFIIQGFVFHSSIVQGESMLPIMEEGDRVIFNKAAYLFEDPERGDIVIIQRPIKNYVKRIVALPGETIEVKDNTLFINGKKHQQSYLPENEIKKTKDFEAVTIPQNSYFVMGDNRLISKDSRNGLGFIEKNEIIGKLEVIFAQLHEFSIVH